MIMEEQGYILVYTISDERIACEDTIYYTLSVRMQRSQLLLKL